MDEIFFHISQQWETLQLYINSGLQHGQEVWNTWYEQAHSLSVNVWSGSWSTQISSISHQTLQILRNIARHCSTVLAQPSEVYYQLTELVRIEMPILYPGSAGFITGTVIGIIIGLSWRKPLISAHRMKAVVCMAYDGLDALSYIDDVIVPSITRPDQLLIQVKAASVDIIDIKICSGYGRVLRKLHHNSSRPVFPIVLGRDCSGIVIEIGSKVSKFEIGDEVIVVSPFWNNGVISEYILTTQDMVCLKPPSVGYEGAAALPYSSCLAYYACLKSNIINNKEPRKRVLIQSGVSPVGCITCQLARYYGCDVTVTCSPRSAPVARALGANEVVVFGHIDMEKQLLKNKFDVVINTMGGVNHELSQALCRPNGVVVSTVPQPIDYDSYTLPSSFVYGLYLKMKYFFKKLKGNANQWSDVQFRSSVLDKVCALVEKGVVQPVVDKVFSPQEAILALQHCDSVDAIGKTVIRFRNRSQAENPTKKIAGMYVTSL